MPQYVAFLRGINVGGHRVKMDRLKELFEGLGLREVSTFIASGNVIFSSSSGSPEALTEKIEQHLARRLGYDVPTFLRSPADLAAIIAFLPTEGGVGGPAHSSEFVIFMRSPASPELRSTFESLNSETDEFQFSGSEVYWRVRGKLSDSPLFGKELEKALRGLPTTMRNLNTLRRISAKAPYQGEPS